MPPPPIPPKDQSVTSTASSTPYSSSSSFLSPHPHSNNGHNNYNYNYNYNYNANNNHINHDLAEAVRDSVQIRTPSPSQQQQQIPPSAAARSRSSILFSTSETSHNPSRAIAPPLPSLDPLVPRRTPSPNPPASSSSRSTATTATSGMSVFQPTHGYSQSSPDMTTVGQPSLPSARMSQLAVSNPFEEDEIEPAGTGRIQPPGHGHQNNRSIGALELETDGTVQPSRAKFVRSHTGAAASTSSSSHLLGPTSPINEVTKTRTRRSMSSDSYGFNPNTGAMRELTAGQKKALEDKKGSRHADVIDTWDPTGLGTAMWHHAGPYDAAAPSRNTNLPTSKAPMQAFHAPPVMSPPRTGPTTISLSSPPVPPAKDIPIENGDKTPHRRGMSGNRHGVPANTRRVSGGGLTGQYSTSMPAGGGYFPNMDAEPMDEAALMRKERQREREAKRQALKAAWGTDTPEPFEDFGGSPQDGKIELTEADLYSPESLTGPPSGRPARSPGIRFGLGATSPAIMEDEPTSPTTENAPNNLRAAPGAGAGGLKRNKSLMQKIKTMRENPNNPARSSSPKTYSPVEGVVVPSPSSETASYASQSSSTEFDKEKKKPGFFSRGSGRSSPSKKGVVGTVPASGSGSTSVSASGSGSSALPTAPTSLSNSGSGSAADIVADNDTTEDLIVPSKNGSGFVFVESPNSKARAMRALKKEQEHTSLYNHQQHHHHHSSANAHANANGVSSVPVNRAKYLPTPPVAPVIPDFDDLVAAPPARRGSPLEVPSDGNEGLKRKTSMVKKLRDRMAK